MTEAWAWAEATAMQRRYPQLDDVIEIGRMVEREKNREGLRRCGVRVGDRVCPPPQDVMRLLKRLFVDGRVSSMEPLDFYRELLEAHPFVDGNGRTGKIVLSWLLSAWDSPVFPPSDFWGTPIQNP